MKPIAVAGSFSVWSLSYRIELSCLTGLYLPLLHLRDHLDAGTNPLNVIQRNLPLDCYVGVVPLLTIHLVDSPTDDAVILGATKDGRIVGGLDTEFHFTDSCGDDHGDGSS